MCAPLVTAVICTYNSQPFLFDAIDSVLRQSFQDFELLIVDDGSTNDCVEQARRRHRDHRIRFVCLPHAGLGAARASAVDAARGRWIAFLDHDDTWRPEKLERQLAAADDNADPALVFSDCELIDAAGRHMGRLGDRFDFASIALRTPEDAYRELLVRGCFIDVSTVLVRTAVLKAIGNFNHRYLYVEDADMWFRIARTHTIACVGDVLSARRIHEGQFTQRNPELRLAEQTSLLRPVFVSASFPPSVKHAAAHWLLGQHLDCARALMTQKRWGLAAGSVLRAVARLPSASAEYAASRLVNTMPVALRRTAKGLRRACATSPAPSRKAVDVWIDGSPLGAMHAGSFTFAAELIRSLARRHAGTVHVSADAKAAQTLEAYMGPDANRVRLHRRRTAGRGDGAIELLLWRGRFRFSRSRKLALVADLTTRLYPELHTPFTVHEFDRYLRYVIKHAHGIVTVSDHSRRDIISRLNVFPASVYRIGNRVNAAFEHPSFDPDVPRSYGLTGPYLLVVGTIEPRKNLRRLVQAFERLRQQGHGDVTLAIAGPPGWDEHFLKDLAASPAREEILYLGFVPVEQLPSLYHYARAVTYPSLYEGFGLPVLEAMCCSSVVVASRSSSLPEILGDGIQFDPYCVDAIAAALAAALRLTVDEDAAYRQQCRERARALLKTWSAEPALPGL